MPRKGLVSRRVQATDPVYGNDLVEKFICSMMWDGKKSTAQRVFYGAMDQVAKKTSDDALKMCIAWRKPTRRSPTIAGKEKGNKDWCHRERSSCNPARRQKGCGEHGTSIQTRGHPEHRDHGAHRCRKDHLDRAHPLLHGCDLQ